MDEFCKELALKMLDLPFLLFIGVGILIYQFKSEFSKVISRGGLTLVWGDKSFEISELPEQLNESFAPVSDDIEDLKQRLTALEESTNIAQPDNVKEILSAQEIESAKERMLSALEHKKYRWRSIERLSSIANITVAQASEILRSMQEVVFSRGKSKRTIIRLASR